jgi:dipeptidyl aminopeptidase/acylaminoacyl peptidase
MIPAIANSLRGQRSHAILAVTLTLVIGASPGLRAQQTLSRAYEMKFPDRSNDPGRTVGPMDVMFSNATNDGAFILAPSGRFLLPECSNGPSFMALPDATVHRFDEISGDDNEELTGQFWSWMTNVRYSSVAFSPDGSTLAAPVMINGKTWIAVGNMERRSGRKALFQIPKDFFFSNAVAWSADGKGLYLRLTYRLQRERQNPKNDNPRTESLNVTLRVSRQYAPKHDDYGQVPLAYPGAAPAGLREFIVYYDLAGQELRRVFTGNDITGMVFSPDQRQIVAWQTKNHEIEEGRYSTTSDIYLVALPPPGDLPIIDLAKAKEEERNAGWFDFRGQRIDPVVRDLGSTPDTAWVYHGSWAPDGNRFALSGFRDGFTGEVGVYDVAAKKFTLLTAGNPFSKAIAGSPWRVSAIPNPKVCALSEDMPLWTPDSRNLFTPTYRGQLWRFAADGLSPPEDVTPPIGPGIVRIFASAEANNVAAESADGRLLVQTSDPEKVTDGIAWFDPSSRALSSIYDGRGLIHTGYLGASGDRVYFSETVPESTAQIYELPLAKGATPRALTDYYSDLRKRPWPEIQLLRFTTKEGLLGSGRLHLPPGIARDQRCPLVLMPNPIYRSSEVERWRTMGASILGLQSIRMTPWIEHGYAAMEFDVPMSREGVYADPLKQAAEGYDAAADAALATGRIDSARIALFGEGYGGYLTQGVIGRSDRYRAAVSVDGFGSLSTLAFFGTPFDAVRVRDREGRMEVNFIDSPQRYLDAEPIASFRKAKTPLLLIAGEPNTAEGIAATESFSALSATDVPLVSASYNKSTGDVMLRVFTWLDEHMNGGPATSGLATLPEPLLGNATTVKPGAVGK